MEDEDLQAIARRLDLIELAGKLNEVLWETNRLYETAETSHDYGDVQNALKKVLALLVGEEKVETAYQVILDGESIQTAIEYSESQ